jgi:hypothetical protein
VALKLPLSDCGVWNCDYEYDYCFDHSLSVSYRPRPPFENQRRGMCLEPIGVVMRMHEDVCYLRRIPLRLGHG